MMILCICLIATLNSFSSSAPINNKYSKFVLQPPQLIIDYDSNANGEKLPLNRVARHIFGGYEGFGYRLPSYGYGGYPKYSEQEYNNHYHRRRNGDLLPLSVITIG